MGSSPTLKWSCNTAEGLVEAGADFAEDGAGHLEERDAEDKRENLDGEADDNLEDFAVRVANDSEAGEFRSVEEDGKNGVKENHLGEHGFPLIKPFFSVW